MLLTLEKTLSTRAWIGRIAPLVVLLTACSNEPGLPGAVAGGAAPAPGTGMNPVSSAAGSPAAVGGSTGTGTSGAPAAGATGGAAGRTAAGSGAAGSSSGAAGSSPAGGGAGAAGTGVTAGSGAAGSGGEAGAASMGMPLADCMGGAREACGSITTNEGVKIPFGKYGSIMEPNVGAGFEVAIATGDADGGATCAGFASLFGEDPAATERLLDTADLKFDLYTVYRPANWVEGEKYPILTWGNGTCAQPEGYGPLLRYVASQGFVVIAANSRWVGQNSAMTKALDFLFAANADMASPYFGRLDTEKVGAMGHSQGGGATVTAARDERIKSVILFNGGSSAVKPFFAVSGEKDIGSPTAASMASAVNSASTDGAWLYYHKIKGMGSLAGHLTLMIEPERVIEPTVAFFKYTLQGDMEARTFFVGTDCKLCNMSADFDYGQKGFE